MPPVFDSTLSPARGLVSRLVSPVISPFKAIRNISDFHIEVDHPHRQYSPGDTVTGTVHLSVSKPTRITHVVVCLHGFVQVFQHLGSRDEGAKASNGYLGTGRGSRSGQYFGNGFASLFEDEALLCRDGRLGYGGYSFGFELRFPDHDLPSSIDFERGTITYMITATMTRPTNISPTLSCERKIYFVERIDISPLLPPRPRTITLEPAVRQSRSRKHVRNLADGIEKGRKVDSAHQDSITTGGSGVEALPMNGTLDPTSMKSSSNRGSSDGRPSTQDHTAGGDGQYGDSFSTSTEGQDSRVSLVKKVITATIESQTGGCLRGDVIAIKINVSHIKHVKSVYGVIATLYRQARVDMRPDIPLGAVEKGKASKYEDYYPKSMTGLGGLSLSGAGASHMFRKDLSQAMAPLIVDPNTLTTEVNVKMRVPEEAFPTISTVPGQMISFKYYIEVVVDIQGKLAGQDFNIGTLAGGASHGMQVLNVDGLDVDRSPTVPFASAIVDTTQIRREKNVVSCNFEVVVGTRDSERRKGKQKAAELVVQPETSQPESSQPEAERDDRGQPHAASPNGDWYDWNAYSHEQWYDYEQNYDYDRNYHHGHEHWASGFNPTHNHETASQLPVPQLPIESEMSEKERIRLQEARLLPSQPPGLDDEPGQAGGGATAPYLPLETGFQNGHRESAALPEYAAATGSSPIPPREEMVTPVGPSTRSPELSADGHETTPATLLTRVCTDNKQELHSQQLASETSAPPANELDSDGEGPSALPNPVPSAIRFDEADGVVQDVHDSHADADGTHNLPRYER